MRHFLKVGLHARVFTQIFANFLFTALAHNERKNKFGSFLSIRYCDGGPVQHQERNGSVEGCPFVSLFKRMVAANGSQ